MASKNVINRDIGTMADVAGRAATFVKDIESVMDRIKPLRERLISEMGGEGAGDTTQMAELDKLFDGLTKTVMSVNNVTDQMQKEMYAEIDATIADKTKGAAKHGALVGEEIEKLKKLSDQFHAAQDDAKQARAEFKGMKS